MRILYTAFAVVSFLGLLWIIAAVILLAGLMKGY